jgi:DNA-directed RNA polymerase beta subunit
MSDLNTEDLKKLTTFIVKEQGLLNHHITDFNAFGHAINTIIQNQFSIEATPFENKLKNISGNENINYISFTVKFSNTKLTTPSTSTSILSKDSIPLYPNECNIRALNYTASLSLTVEAEYVAYDVNNKIILRKNEKIENFDLTTIPMMVGSNVCNTSKIRNNPSSMREIKEDPKDQGAYFIMNGIDYYIMCSENVTMNKPYIYLAEKTSKEIAWLELISKPGDSFENSYQSIVRLGKNNLISIEIKQLIEGLHIPFYIMFRMLGITDEMMVNYILMSNDKADPLNKQLLSLLESSFTIPPDDKRISHLHWEYDRNKIILTLGEISRDLESTGVHRNSDEAVNKLISDINFRINKFFMPHIGEDTSSQTKKAKYLGLLIQKLLLVHLKILKPSSRDAYNNKRIHPAGTTLAKAFKNQFNLVVVQKIKRELFSSFKSTAFQNVKLQSILNQIARKSLETALADLITSSDDVITMGRGITVQNRVSSQKVHRKNQLNVLVAGRLIESPSSISKSSQSANERREVKGEFAGFICPLATKDTGEKVGLSKELSIACIISSSIPLGKNNIMDLLEDDELFIKLADSNPVDIASKKLAKIFINGDWVGLCEKPHLICANYREFRRTDILNIHISIYWDEILDEIHFQTDQGRLLRPVIIIDNNLYDVIDAEMKKNKTIPEFIQKPRLTKEHITQLVNEKISFMDLVKNGIMEYISIEEMLNCFIAPDIENIKNDIEKIYTHLEIPHTLFGLSAHGGVLLNFNAPTRSTYETNQIKQTSGHYSLSWPWRLDKNASYQVNCSHPLIRTIVNDFIDPIGDNVIVAYIPRDGNMQEDSVIMNKSSIDLGLYYTSYLNYEQTKIKNNEIIKIPGEDTIDIKSKNSYSKLESNGFMKTGTIIENGDIIIPKLQIIGTNKKNKNYKYIDKSIVYRNDEPARVEQLTRMDTTQSGDGNKIYYIKTVSELPVSIGDKFSTREGNKSIVADIIPSIDMPISASGTSITYLINPQTITSRMVVAQIIEGVLAKLAAQKGVFMDASVFTKINIDEIRLELTRFGMHNTCMEQLYCGRTGLAIDALIVVCPLYLQRLQKYVIKEGYSIRNGPKNELTGQPVSGGRANNGGAKHGEMEVDVLAAHGSMNILKEIMFDNSDGVKLYVCKKCGNRADVSVENQVFKCKTCMFNADIVEVDSCKASNLFFNYINTMSIGTTFNF